MVARYIFSAAAATVHEFSCFFKSFALWQSDHLSVTLTGSHHRIAVFISAHLHVEEKWAIVGEHFGDRL